MRSRSLVILGVVTVLAAAGLSTALLPALGRAFTEMKHAEATGPGTDVVDHNNDVMIGAPEPEDAGSSESLTAVQPRTVPAEGAPVSVGLYIMDISHINFTEGTFAIDAYVWMNWDPALFLAPGAEPGEGPGALPRAPCDTFGFVAAFELEVTPVVKKAGYAQFRVIGSVREEFALARFPLDRHVLRLALEDQERPDHILRYEADVRNSGATEFRITGWTYDRPTVSTYTRTYQTNFGDRSIPTGDETHFAGIVFEIPIRQVRLAYFVKLTFGLFISTILALISLVVAHYGVDRIGFPVGALFAVVASQWFVSGSLPPRAPPTIADWLHVTSFAVILAVTLVNIRSLLVLESGDPQRSKAIDRFWFRLIAPTWIALCIVICIVA